MSNFFYLCKDEYGIFVLSAMLDHALDYFKDQILGFLKNNVAYMALQKDGSKLIENCIKMIGRIHTLNLN